MAQIRDAATTWRRGEGGRDRRWERRNGHRASALMGACCEPRSFWGSDNASGRPPSMALPCNSMSTTAQRQNHVTAMTRRRRAEPPSASRSVRPREDRVGGQHEQRGRS